MSYQAHKICDHLFQGGFPPPGADLSKVGVDVLVLCAAEWQEAGDYPNVQVILAPGDDDPRPHRLARFIDTWKDAAKQVVEHVLAGRNVLVTCMAGQNRSGIVSAMALTQILGINGKEAVDIVSRSRPHALNNNTFAQYVIDNF